MGHQKKKNERNEMTGGAANSIKGSKATEQY